MNFAATQARWSGDALHEHTERDLRRARVVTRDLADYHVPVNADVPAIDVISIAVALGAGWLLVELWPIVLLIVVALMVVGMLSPPIEWLEHRGVGRGRAIVLVFAGLFVVSVGTAALTIPNLVHQLSDIVDRLPHAQGEVAAFLEHHHLTQPLAQSVRGARSTELVAKLASGLLSNSTQIIELIAYTVTCLFLALYMILDRDRMRGALFAVVPRSSHVRFSRILLHLETIVGGYMRGQVLTSVMMGGFTLTVLLIARIPNALALSVFAALMDVLPYIGGLLACGPAVLATSSRGLPAAIAVLVALAAYQELESRIIVPRVYGRVLRLPAATVMIALLVGGKLLGILGALLALPIAAGLRMVVEELRVVLPGEDVDDASQRNSDIRKERAYEALAAGVRVEDAAAIATKLAEDRIERDAGKGADPVLSEAHKTSESVRNTLPSTPPVT